MEENIEKLVESRHDEILNQAKQGNIMFYDGFTTHVYKLEDFVKQGATGMLYDLNRLEEVTVTLAKNNTKVSMLQRFDNDMAMATLVRYLCSKLNLGE